mmetsp:Transcript_119718/g.211631  ORF Transcript_119718/g.211631 Transcript_119718/m.211631 type:complete len:313 (+) Transcript_119718:39-977(+)
MCLSSGCKMLLPVLLFIGSQCCSSAVLLRRSNPAAPLHSALAHGHTVNRTKAGVDSGSLLNSSKVNASVPFSLHDYPPAIGKVFAIYYSHSSNQDVTSVEARDYQSLSTAPADDEIILEPQTMKSLPRGQCPLRLNAHIGSPSAERKANLRLAELAVCEAYGGQPCGANDAGCELDIWAPLPDNNAEEASLGAAIALAAHSALCGAVHTETWQSGTCKIVRDKTALSAGLQKQLGSSSVTLRSFPGPWVDKKLDSCYVLGFKGAVFADGNRASYLSSQNYALKDDVLHWSRAPPAVQFCSDLSCLVQKLETR